jgi:hypothetical protein
VDGVVDAIALKPNQFTMMDYNFPLFMGLAIQMYESTLVSDNSPFDHPQLFYPDGHPGNQNSVTNDGTGQATDSLDEIPAVGSNGRTTPEPNFLE